MFGLSLFGNAVSEVLNVFGKSIERKTPSETKTEAVKVCIPPKKESNPLNGYRSYTYNFTLAALKADALKNPDSYKLNSDYYVIAKSGGKGVEGIKTTSSFEYEKINPKKTEPSRGGRVRDRFRKNLVEGFNKESPGRFDFYIDNVEIESIISGNESTSLTTHTKLQFQIIEPYSMTGFIEALQASAVSAGHENYVQCPYLFKIEFRGYPDNQTIPNPELVPNSTRWIVIKFVKVDVKVNASGTLYDCEAVPFNEVAFGEASRLSKDITATGSTVGEVLSTFSTNLNKSNVEEAKQEGRDIALYDEYEIIFPEKNAQSLDKNTKNKISSSKIGEFLKSNNVYKFKDEDDDSKDTKLIPSDRLTAFSQGADVQDVIASVIRDSDYIKDVISKKPDDKGLIPYFFVHSEVEIKGYDSKTNRDYHKYKFLVVPYDMHYTRITPRPNCVIDSCRLKDTVHREYNYIYTGKNVDLLKFDLRFNTLFYQAIPRGLGNLSSIPASSQGVQSTDPNAVKLNDSCKIAGAAPIRVSSERSKPTPDGTSNAILPQADPYTILARSIHKAILENVDQVTADIEIIGDPYYLATSGTGNQPIKFNTDGTLENGEAPIYTTDVHILIKFKNPVDIDEKTGFVYFDNRVALYSGVFRVIQVKSNFKDGKFKQTLSLVRLPTQIEDTDELPPTRFEPIIQSSPDPAKASTPTPPAPLSALRSTSEDLISDIASGSPLAGLPGETSVLIPGDAGLLAGSRPGVNPNGSLVNQIRSLSVGVDTADGRLANQLVGPLSSGLSNLDSAIRLGTAGLSAFSTNPNETGGLVRDITNISNTIGYSQVTPQSLGQGLQFTGASTFDKVGFNAMSKVKNLANAASGLTSGVSSKIRSLNGETQALATQLGITPSTLAGLSSNLKTSIVEKINNAISSVPNDVDITDSVKNGLLLNNVPTKSLANIPATQPKSVAPSPRLNLSDIKTILERGGSLENIPGTANIAGVEQLLASVQTRSLSQLSGINSSVINDKLSTIQSGLQSIAGKTSSLEANVNTVRNVSSSLASNVADVSSSVINKFGSVSERASPLTTLIKNKTLA